MGLTCERLTFKNSQTSGCDSESRLPSRGSKNERIYVIEKIANKVFFQLYKYVFLEPYMLIIARL
jgi:hypothetical protein